VFWLVAHSCTIFLHYFVASFWYALDPGRNINSILYTVHQETIRVPTQNPVKPWWVAHWNPRWFLLFCCYSHFSIGQQRGYGSNTMFLNDKTAWKLRDNLFSRNWIKGFAVIQIYHINSFIQNPCSCFNTSNRWVKQESLLTKNVSNVVILSCDWVSLQGYIHCESKKDAIFWFMTSSNYWSVLKTFHCHAVQEICNKAIIKDPISLQKRRYTIKRCTWYFGVGYNWKTW